MKYRTLSREEFENKYGNSTCINNLEYVSSYFPIEPIYFKVENLDIHRDSDGDISIDNIPELSDDPIYSESKSYITDDVIVKLDDEDDWKNKLENLIREGRLEIQKIMEETNVNQNRKNDENEFRQTLITREVGNFRENLNEELKKIKRELKVDLKAELKAEIKRELKVDLEDFKDQQRDDIGDLVSQEAAFWHESMYEEFEDITKDITEKLTKELTVEVEDNKFPTGKVVAGITFVGIGIYLFNKLR